MSFFKNNPFVRIILFWLTGILLCKYFYEAIYLLIPCSLLLLVYSLVLFKNKQYTFDFVSSLFIGSALCLLAFSFSLNPKETIIEKHTGHYQFVLLERPTEKQNSFQLNVEIIKADSSVLEQKKAIIYTRKSKTIENLKAGNQLFCETTLHRIKNRGNPFEFDYAGYMSHQAYFYNAFINDNDIQVLKDSKKSPIYLAENFRNRLLQILKTHIHSNEAVQVISALSLGYRKELSSEIKSRFAATGAMHVLAVSGLHVGMIYLFLSLLFSFFKRRKTGRWIYVFLIAGILWCYALITGFSPSVQRATVMFSFILIGNSLKRPTSIYNSLAASAFLLLLFKPDLLFEVGFQLSYMAVLSIVFFYPRLEKLFQPKYWLTKKVWQLSCISIAAQIGTFPLSIYYFNQFPVYFFLSNLIVIPAAYLILGFTFSFLLTSPVQIISSFIAKLLESITEGTIYLLSKIENFPYSLIEGISISTIQLFSLVLIFVSGIFFIKWKRKIYFFISLIVLIFFLLDGLVMKHQLFNQKKIIVYNSNERVVHLINNRKNYLLSFNEEKPTRYLFKNTLKELQLNDPVLINISKVDSLKMDDLIIKNGIIQFGNQSFYANQNLEPNQKSNLLLNYTKIEGRRNLDSPSIFILEKKQIIDLSEKSYLLHKHGAFTVDF